MTGRCVVIIAVLFQLFAFSLLAQSGREALHQSKPQTKQELTKALQDARGRKDGQGEAIALLQLGVVEAEAGDVDGARPNLLEAVKKMRAQKDAVGAWLALTLLAQIEAATGRPTEALAHVEAALAVLNEAKTSSVPLNLETFMTFGSISGIALPSLQVPDEATANLVKPILIQYSFEPMTQDLYGSVLTMAGQFEKAETALKAAAAGSALAQGMYDYSIETHFGDLRFRQARYDDARTHYKKALAASSKLPVTPKQDQQMKAGIYDRLARLETITGNPEEAKRWSEKAAGLARTNTQSR